MENRIFTRVEFSGCASVRYDDTVVWGTVGNMSMQGFHISTPGDLPLNIPLEVTIHNSPNSSIHVRASAVHCEEAGAGMKLIELDVNSFVKLRDAITFLCDDQDLILSESYKLLNCINYYSDQTRTRDCVTSP